MKKVAVVALAAALSAGTMVGCSTGTTEPQQTAASTATPEAKKQPTKFSISYPTTTNTGYHTRVDINNDKWVKKLEELTNTDLTLKVTEVSKMGLMFASNDVPDVVGSLGTATDKAMSGSVEAGMFMPLDDLLKQNAPNLMKMVPKEAWEAVSYNGKIYGIPNWLNNPSRRATFIRTDLLEKAGLPAPKTVEEFVNVLRKFKDMGVKYPYGGRETLKYADTILGAFDVLPYKEQFELINGQVVPKFFDVENMTKALTVYKTMYDEGLMAKEFATTSSTDWLKNIRAGEVGIWSSNLVSLNDFRTNIPNAVKGAKIDVISSPKGPDGKSGYLMYLPVTSAHYINKNVKPETAADIVKYFDWMSSDEAYKFFTFGIEGDTYTVVDGKIKYKEPTNKEEQEEQDHRGTLHSAHESTVNRLKMETDPNGPYILNAFDNILAQEGLSGIGFAPDLEANSKFPDAASPGSDAAPKIIMDHMIKMIYGKESIADWPKVIEEYKSKGGNEIIKEATERYQNKKGVLFLGKKLG
ncbi:extracellular solute-binding protein [Paenibacillus sp. 5J-6]|uniref:Extracellular solute-binding protein n=1 Tax=Paenibacillus silvestris TaxID=2606219 RepID=A0A6L8V3L9_9BACL|nr:extracellular solute-binding protein [Paenibacillus silvestris]MZQ84794.1 extracellular solute-binding protein [Paenibacillus silvestris]